MAREPAPAAPTPQEVCAHMFAADRASQGLGMRIVAVGAGSARLEMAVRDDMLNGHEICHGGFITTLADSAFAFACNSRNEVTVGAGLTVDFLAPVQRGDVLTADARRGRADRPHRRLRHRRHQPRRRARRPGPRPLGAARRSHRHAGRRAEETR